MWLIADTPVIVRLARGEVTLAPGIPHELPEAVGQRVLACAGHRVHVHEPEPDTVIEPASATARPIYWEGIDGEVLGPAVPESLAKTGTADREQFWVIVTYEGIVRWIHADRLRATPRHRTLAP